jgi:hypothetical protein
MSYENSMTSATEELGEILSQTRRVVCWYRESDGTGSKAGVPIGALGFTLQEAPFFRFARRYCGHFAVVAAHRL